MYRSMSVGSEDIKNQRTKGCSAGFCWGYSEHVGKMTDTRKQKTETASEKPTKHSLFVGNMQIG